MQFELNIGESAHDKKNALLLYIIIINFQSPFSNFQIYNGDTSNDQLLTSPMCGNSVPVPTLTSSSEAIFIHFHSDLMWSGRGFNITYKAI